MQTDSKNHDTPTDANNVLAADADYWITATPEEVRKFLRENTNIKDYEQKKKQLLCEIEKRKSKS